MTSEEQLRETMRALLGSHVSRDFPFGKVVDRLNAKELEHSIVLSPYGYVMWAVDHYGSRCAFTNLMASDTVVGGYASAASKLKDDMPEMLLNAHTYVSKVLANVADLDACLTQLEGMTFPYVLYVLFAGSGQERVVDRYRPAAEEQLKRYPSTLDRLPESYRKVKEMLLDVDSK